MDEQSREKADAILAKFPPPRPTGNRIPWRITPSTAQRLEALKEALYIAMVRGDEEAYGTIGQQIASLPGHPACREGDSIEIEVIDLGVH